MFVPAEGFGHRVGENYQKGKGQKEDRNEIYDF
jgi:hypothetical protein